MSITQHTSQSSGEPVREVVVPPPAVPEPVPPPATTAVRAHLAMAICLAGSPATGSAPTGK